MEHNLQDDVDNNSYDHIKLTVNMFFINTKHVEVKLHSNMLYISKKMSTLYTISEKITVDIC